MKRVIPAVILALLVPIGLSVPPSSAETRTSSEGMSSAEGSGLSPRNGAITLYVDDTGTDSGTCGPSGQLPCQTISQAIINAAFDDTIQIEAGTYREDVLVTKRLHFVGPNDDTPFTPTDINNQPMRNQEAYVEIPTSAAWKGSTGGFVFASGSSGSTIDGLAFMRKQGTDRASVFRLVRTTSPVEVAIRNSLFDLRLASQQACGAAISSEDQSSSFTITGSLITGNYYNAICDPLRYASRALYLTGSKRVLIGSNVITDSGQPVYLTSLVDDSAAGAEVVGNYFQGNGQSLTVGTTPRGIRVIGNTFDGGNGVYLDGSRSASVKNNLFCGGAGGGPEAPGLFPQCTLRTGFAIWSQGAQSQSGASMNAILGGYTAFGPPYLGRTLFNMGTNTVTVSNNWWGTAMGDDSIAAKLWSSPGGLPFSPWIEVYADDPAKVGQPGFWPIIPALDVVTPVPANPDDSVVVAASGFFTGNSVEITFPTVASAGVTTVTAFDPNGDDTTPFPQAPSGFSLGDSPVYYTITTTATVTFPVTLCFSYAPGSFTSPPKLYHFTGSPGAWVERVTSYQDNPTRACAQVPSFSPFALGVPTPSPGPGPGPVVQPPSQPRNVVGVPGDTVAQLSWAEPVSSGSSAIVGYRVERSDAEGVWSVAIANTGSAGRTVQVSGLVNGTAYRFRVTAINAVGPGPASDPSNAVTPFAPESVSILITGARTTIKGKPGIRVSGETTGLDAGAVLRPWFRFPGQKAFTRGTARILVGANAAFTWQRQTGKKITVYIQAGDGTRSNRVVIPAR